VGQKGGVIFHPAFFMYSFSSRSVIFIGMVKLTLEKFIERSNHIHHDKYDYSKSVYVNNKIHTIIICPIHGEFLQIPLDHLQGKGCNFCGHNETGRKKRLTLNNFIESANKIHEYRYNYSKVKYEGAYEKVIIICLKHGEFSQIPHNHLCGKGCPKCNASKGEIKISNFLSENKIEYIPQYKFDNCKNPKTNYKLRFDFYLPSKNVIIEYDGEQHFNTGYIGGNYFTTIKDLEELKYRDSLKDKFAIENNIFLLRIKPKDLKNIKGIFSFIL